MTQGQQKILDAINGLGDRITESESRRAQAWKALRDEMRKGFKTQKALIQDSFKSQKAARKREKKIEPILGWKEVTICLLGAALVAVLMAPASAWWIVLLFGP